MAMFENCGIWLGGWGGGVLSDIPYSLATSRDILANRAQKKCLMDCNRQHLYKLSNLTDEISAWDRLKQFFCIYYIQQDSHQLSTCKSGCSRHFVCDVHYTRHFFEAHFHYPRRDDWYCSMQTPNRWKRCMGWWSVLGSHSACSRHWKILCNCISFW